MKKTFYLIGIIILSLGLLLACTVNEDKENQTEQVVELAGQYIDVLDQGNFAEATELFDQTVQAELSEEILTEIWQQLTEQLGEFQGHELNEVSNVNEYRVVLLDGEFAQDQILFEINFNQNNQIAGFFIHESIDE